MSTVISVDFRGFHSVNPSAYMLAGTEVDPPTTRQEYLDLVKEFLSEDRYRDVLCSILDVDYYSAARPEIQNVVDHYLMFKR